MTLPKLIAGVTFAVTASTIGDLLLARGMRKIGQIRWLGLPGTIQLVRKILTTPDIAAAILFLAMFFFSWLALLSRVDLSLILPMTALTYILNAIAAKPVLGEKVSKRRWLGILIISAGVVLVTWSSKSS